VEVQPPVLQLRVAVLLEMKLKEHRRSKANNNSNRKAKRSEDMVIKD
jgi:hypothetical protein